MYLFKTNLPDTCELPQLNQWVEILEKLEWTIFLFFFFNLYLNNYQKTDTEERHSVPLISNTLRPQQLQTSYCR